MGGYWCIQTLLVSMHVLLFLRHERLQVESQPLSHCSEWSPTTSRLHTSVHDSSWLGSCSSYLPSLSLQGYWSVVAKKLQTCLQRGITMCKKGMTDRELEQWKGWRCGLVAHNPWHHHNGSKTLPADKARAWGIRKLQLMHSHFSPWDIMTRRCNFWLKDFHRGVCLQQGTVLGSGDT